MSRTFGRVIVGHLPITIQCDTYLTFLDRFEEISIQFDGVGMGKNQMVTNTIKEVSSAKKEVWNRTNPHPGFRGGVAFG